MSKTANLNKYNDKTGNYIQLVNFYKENKYDEYLKYCDKYLNRFKFKKFPIKVYYMRARIYRNIGRLDDAIKDLELILQNDSNDIPSFIELFFDYYYIGDYKSVLKLLPTMKKLNCVEYYSIYLIELIVNIKLNLNNSKKITKNDNYTVNQICNYSKEEALTHISIHKLENSYKSEFNNNVNIEYLYELITNVLPKSKKNSKVDVLNEYYFSISNIGYYQGNMCNYIKVIVVPFTSNIISIYPTYEVIEKDVNIIDFDYDKLFNKSKVKSIGMSQRDKFNARYGLK